MDQTSNGISAAIEILSAVFSGHQEKSNEIFQKFLQFVVQFCNELFGY